jgi:hypothetical protein
MDEGKLRRADPRVAGLHLHALLEAEWLDRFLFQTVDRLSRRQISEAVERSVAVFMAAYGPVAAPAVRTAGKAPGKSGPTRRKAPSR